jgi:hypothetical protein
VLSRSLTKKARKDSSFACFLTAVIEKKIGSFRRRSDDSANFPTFVAFTDNKT